MTGRAWPPSSYGPGSRVGGAASLDFFFQLWQCKIFVLQAYQQFSSIVYRMRREILTLHARLALQDETISRLQRNDQSVGMEEAELKERIENLRDKIDSMKKGKLAGEFVC